jgi:hypothetical protein
MVEIVPKDISVKGSEKDLAKIGTARIAPTLEDLKAGESFPCRVEIVSPKNSRRKYPLSEAGEIQCRSRGRSAEEERSGECRIIGKPVDDFRLKAVWWNRRWSPWKVPCEARPGDEDRYRNHRHHRHRERAEHGHSSQGAGRYAL